MKNKPVLIDFSFILNEISNHLN